MRKFKSMYSLMVAIFLLLQTGTVLAKSTNQIYEESKGSIVLLISYDKHNIPLSLGSGFFIDSNHIATNYHVVDGASKVVYQIIGSTKSHKVESISSYSKNLDIALLYVVGNHKPLNIRKSLASEIGTKVIAIGNPKGLTGSVSEGIISGIRKHKDFVFIQITAPISPGSSGGPLFNNKGEVIGVTTMTLKDSQNINFAVSSHLIFDLTKHGKNWEPTVPNKVFKPRKGSAGIKLIEPRVTNISGGQFAWSVSNKSGNRIKNLAYILIFRNSKSGEVLHYKAFKDSSEIPAGLSKRNSEWMRETLSNYQVLGESIYPHSQRSMYGYVTVELRVLSYDIVESKIGIGVLDLIR